MPVKLKKITLLYEVQPSIGNSKGPTVPDYYLNMKRSLQ